MTDVTTDGDLARVRLSRVDGGNASAFLWVDMARSLLVRYERPNNDLRIVDIRTHRPPPVHFDAVGRRIPDQTWLGPPEVELPPGVVRCAG